MGLRIGTGCGVREDPMSSTPLEARGSADSNCRQNFAGTGSAAGVRHGPHPRERPLRSQAPEMNTCSAVRSSLSSTPQQDHMTVGLAVSGRQPAARTGPERNMPAPLSAAARRARPGSRRRTIPAARQVTAAACQSDAALLLIVVPGGMRTTPPHQHRVHRRRAPSDRTAALRAALRSSITRRYSVRTIPR